MAHSARPHHHPASEDVGTARVVIVSNRLPALSEAQTAGGLVSAVLPGLEGRRGAWIGWSGRVDSEPATVTVEQGNIRYVALDLTPDEYEAYYEHYANGTLWPVMHGLPERARIDSRDYPEYRQVVRRFAEQVVNELCDGDLVWVHDYHLLPLGYELRRLGWEGAIGYFHHIPVPTEDDWLMAPGALELSGTLSAYDLLGVQTPGDAERLRALVDRATSSRIGVYPVAVDAKALRALADSEPPPARACTDRALLFAVDRLDYTKGIPQRLQAFESLLEQRPDLRGRVFLLQWAPVSRGELPEYQRERADVERLERQINQRWSPEHVAVSFEHHPRSEVIAQLRASEICLTTPLRDGMNLVAKEYAATHDAERPGVLVLSTTCGAAHELREAVPVDPLDLESMRCGIERAIDMDRTARARRAAALWIRVSKLTPQRWFNAFTEDLIQSRLTTGFSDTYRRRTPLPIRSG